MKDHQVKVQLKTEKKEQNPCLLKEAMENILKHR